jgi:hypothetical protein
MIVDWAEMNMMMNGKLLAVTRASGDDLEEEHVALARLGPNEALVLAAHGDARAGSLHCPWRCCAHAYGQPRSIAPLLSRLGTPSVCRPH